jgi:type II secretory pathway component PulJ
MRTERDSTPGGFTLFEVLIALAVFMLAVTGIAAALQTALQSQLEIRRRMLCRQELESRIAFCMADPPTPGASRVIDAKENHGVRVEESVTPFTAKNAKGVQIAGIQKLVIRTKSADTTDSAEILISHP